MKLYRKQYLYWSKEILQINKNSSLKKTPKNRRKLFFNNEAVQKNEENKYIGVKKYNK